MVNSMSVLTGRASLAVLVACMLASCWQSQGDAVGRVSDVEAAAPDAALLWVPGAPPGSTVVDGLIDAHAYIDVSFARSGVIAELGPVVGDTVLRGQFLGVLESEVLREKITAARSQRNNARRGLPRSRLSRNGPPPAYLERSARSRKRDIGSSVAMKDADLRRLRRAVEAGGQKEATRVALSILEQRNRKPSSRTAERVARERHTQRLYDDLVHKVQKLEYAIDASRLISPAAGEVVEVNAFVGDTWNPRSRNATFRLMDARRLVVWTEIPERLASTLVPGWPVYVNLIPADGVGEGAVVRGRVKELDGRRVETVGDDGEIELVREVRVHLPAELPSWLEVGDEAVVAFPP